MLMVEIFLALMEFEFDAVQAVAAGLVLCSIHVGQLEPVIMCCCHRTVLNLFVERLRVAVFHQHVNEELLWRLLIEPLASQAKSLGHW
jgi:hypothetical protein